MKTKRSNIVLGRVFSSVFPPPSGTIPVKPVLPGGFPSADFWDWTAGQIERLDEVGSRTLGARAKAVLAVDLGAAANASDRQDVHVVAPMGVPGSECIAAAPNACTCCACFC